MIPTTKTILKLEPKFQIHSRKKHESWVQIGTPNRTDLDPRFKSILDMKPGPGVGSLVRAQNQTWNQLLLGSQK